MSESPSIQELFERVLTLVDGEPELAERLERVRAYSTSIRASEYHVTNACNLRCEGCWFFANEFDTATDDDRDEDRLRQFVRSQRDRGINAALLIGGEPTLFPRRVRVYVDEMEYVTISTNGIKPLPREGFEDVMVAITLFGGGPLDDELRGIRPSGSRFDGLLDIAFDNYRGDDRAGFVFAMTERGIDYIEPTVRRIAEEGHPLILNFYSSYGSDSPLFVADRQRLLDEALRVKEAYPETVLSHPHYIEALITGESHGQKFGYDVCPSISTDFAGHAERLRNGNPVLRGFNAWAPDLQTVQFCCTSGHCNDCRDSQAVASWLLVSWRHFLDSVDSLRNWVEMSEAYWSCFVWSPFSAVRATVGSGTSLGSRAS